MFRYRLVLLRRGAPTETVNFESIFRPSYHTRYWDIWTMSLQKHKAGDFILDFVGSEKLARDFQDKALFLDCFSHICVPLVGHMAVLLAEFNKIDAIIERLA